MGESMDVEDEDSPYGLNDLLGDEYKRRDTHEINFHL